MFYSKFKHPLSIQKLNIYIIKQKLKNTLGEKDNTKNK